MGLTRLDEKLTKVTPGQAAAVKKPRRKRPVRVASHRIVIRCVNCHDEVTACDGKYGDWMHEISRSEFCHPGTIDQSLAFPD